jgi:benzoate-CoA ligase
MTDSAESIAALLAVLKLGGIAVPMTPDASRDDFTFYLTDTGAKFSICDRRAVAWLGSTVGDSTKPVVNLDVDALQYKGSLQSQPTSDGCGTCSLIDESPALVLYTSGTTSLQKPVLHSHGSIIAAINNIGRDAFAIKPADFVLNSARLFFAFGLGFGVYLPLGCGATTVLLPSRELPDLVQAIRSLRPHIFSAVPSVLDSLFRATLRARDFDLACARFIISAGETLSARLLNLYWTRFGIEVLDGIGSTEMLTHFITNRPGRSRAGSCGTVVRGCEVALLDEHQNPVPEGEVGTLYVNGETAFLRYFRESLPADRSRKRGIVTGDKLYRDADGFYYHCGRSDEMLKVAGMWVSPKQVETLLSDHPEIERCAVTTRDDRMGRRRLVAYVVPKAGSALKFQELYRYVGGSLPNHMIPAAFVPVPELPLTKTGKVCKRALPDPDWLAG